MGKVDPRLLEYLAGTQDPGVSHPIFLLPGIFVKARSTTVGFFETGADTHLKVS